MVRSALSRLVWLDKLDSKQVRQPFHAVLPHSRKVSIPSGPGGFNDESSTHAKVLDLQAATLSLITRGVKRELTFSLRENWQRGVRYR